MSHLHTERLAALADQLPTAEEAEHLAACRECATERDAHRAVLEMAGESRRSIAAPLTDWESLSTALRSEGMMSDEAAGPALVRQSPWSGRMLRVAAAILLVAGGAFIGRYTASAESLAVADNAGTGSGVPSAEMLLPEYTSPEEARLALARYETAYLHAASFLDAQAENVQAPGEGGHDPDTYRTRLAALDRVGTTMREALSESPLDPLINSYYMTAMSQRAATMRQLNRALPAEARLVGF
jgi:hypothetical protein